MLVTGRQTVRRPRRASQHRVNASTKPSWTLRFDWPATTAMERVCGCTHFNMKNRTPDLDHYHCGWVHTNQGAPRPEQDPAADLYHAAAWENVTIAAREPHPSAACSLQSQRRGSYPALHANNKNCGLSCLNEYITTSHRAQLQNRKELVGEEVGYCATNLSPLG